MLGFLFYWVFSFQVQANLPVGAITWIGSTEHDFGDLAHLKPVAHTFRFKNISDHPLVIDNVRPACGCTTPDWTTRPILPDSTAEIKIEYDARDQGYFRKSIKVYVSGQRKAEKLWIEGFVAVPDE